MFIELVMPSNHLILCQPLLLPPSIFPRIRVFSSESALCIRWPKYWSFSFNISPSNEYSGLISFRMDWLDLLVVQGTLKSLLQHHSSKASILQCLAFFIVQLSHPYMSTGKTITLTRWTFVGKVMSLLFNMLSRLVIIFLPRSKHLLISWLKLPSAVTLEPPQNKVWNCFPIYLPWSDETRYHNLHFSNESTLLIRWPKYWSFSFNISPFNEHPGLISFRMDWLDLLAVQGTLKSLLQHHTVQKHQFFGAQLSSQSNSHIHTWPLEKP